MFQFIVLSLAVVYVNAKSYGGLNGGLVGGLSGGLVGLNGGHNGGVVTLNGGHNGGLVGGLSGGVVGFNGGHNGGAVALNGGLNGYGGEGLALTTGTGYAHQPVLRAQNYGPVNAAIQSVRTVEFVPMNFPQELAAPQVIEVEPYEQPVQMIFRSATSPLLVSQVHHAGPPAQHEATRSEEEASHLLHEVFKPVIQEFREVIQPFRKITQEVKPVIEEVHTLVAEGKNLRTPVLRADPVVHGGPVLVDEQGPLLAKNYKS